MPCPLTLACRSTLTTVTGREIAKYLIRHGANVNYQDHALRNALYWAVSLTISYINEQSKFIIKSDSFDCLRDKIICINILGIWLCSAACFISTRSRS